MDIVKRAYLKVREYLEEDQGAAYVVEMNMMIRDEVIRLIRVGAYRPQDWPTELGPFPKELKK